MVYVKPVAPPQKCAWAVKEWCADTALSKATLYRLLATGYPRSVLIGKKRLITTAPAEFIRTREDETAA